MNKFIEVSVGLIFNSQRQILLAWRDALKTPGDCWEFPGGKLEIGETSYQALCRELLEEIDIIVDEAIELKIIQHEYQTMHVVLHLWHVKTYQRVPRGVEGQKLKWMFLDNLQNIKLPDANLKILEFLNLKRALFYC